MDILWLKIQASIVICVVVKRRPLKKDKQTRQFPKKRQPPPNINGHRKIESMYSYVDMYNYNYHDAYIMKKNKINKL